MSVGDLWETELPHRRTKFMSLRKYYYYIGDLSNGCRRPMGDRIASTENKVFET